MYIFLYTLYIPILSVTRKDFSRNYSALAAKCEIMNVSARNAVRNLWKSRPGFNFAPIFKDREVSRGAKFRNL